MEKENKVSCDLEKSKIEVVRDALKDAIDTIRAQDRKASYSRCGKQAQRTHNNQGYRKEDNVPGFGYR